jgi:uncharacterized iron-regulated membrane protein
MTGEMVAMWLIPVVTVGTLVWRLSSKLTQMDLKLDRLEEENRRLRADLRALERLLSLFVDKAGIKG